MNFCASEPKASLAVGGRQEISVIFVLWGRNAERPTCISLLLRIGSPETTFECRYDLL